VKAVADTLQATQADPATLIALGEGIGRAIYVQWSDATNTTLTRFDSSGTAQVKAISRGGRGGHGVAVPSAVVNGQTQDCVELPVDTMVQVNGPVTTAQDLFIDDAVGGGLDWEKGSTLGTFIPAGGSRAFLAGRLNAWTKDTFAVPGPDAKVFVTPVRFDGCKTAYAEGELYTGTSQTPNDDGYMQGRLLSLGLPFDFTVAAAVRLPNDGVVVAGTEGPPGPVWVASLDARFAPVHQSSFPIVGLNGPAATRSVAVDAAGNVYVCGSSATTLQGWIAQGLPDLTGWKVVTLPLKVGGCAMTNQGSLIVSGSYAGTFDGKTSKGDTDLFLARFTPGAGGAGPKLASFARHGSSDQERNVSPPFAASDGSVFVAGVTLGNWGDAVGPGRHKVFVARFDPVSLALK
jgi:hypothetical protein